jgi:hypothetical protein
MLSHNALSQEGRQAGTEGREGWKKIQPKEKQNEEIEM